MLDLLVETRVADPNGLSDSDPNFRKRSGLDIYRINFQLRSNIILFYMKRRGPGLNRNPSSSDQAFLCGRIRIWSANLVEVLWLIYTLMPIYKIPFLKLCKYVYLFFTCNILINFLMMLLVDLWGLKYIN